MEDEESLPFVNMERSITGNIHQLGNIVRKENGKKKNTYLPWSKNSIERLMISSSVIILLSSSATCPRSSFDPLEARGKSEIGLKYRFLEKNRRNFIFQNTASRANHCYVLVPSLSSSKRNTTFSGKTYHQRGALHKSLFSSSFHLRANSESKQLGGGLMPAKTCFAN